MIVQELHKIQQRHGFLPKDELHELSHRLGTPLYRLNEVASFFPHFRLEPGPKVEVLVCHDMACHLRGGELMREELQRQFPEGSRDVAVRPVSCLGRCDRAVAATVNGRLYVNCDAARLADTAKAIAAGTKPAHDRDDSQARHAPQPWLCDVYQGKPEYRAARAFLANADADGFAAQLKDSDLRGMGGAGVPAHQKWTDVRNTAGDQKFIVCNADESEPTTFKDRELLLRTPHLIVEGMILAGLFTGATRGYVYVRHEYHEQIEAVQHEIDRAEALGACGANVFNSGRPFFLEVFESPGGYICGEQSALIEAMEDRRAQPRNKPPQLETNGLYDKPTLVSNVETFAWVPSIAIHGGAWYRDLGRPGCRGARFFSICGDVRKPGAYEVPCGITLGELIDDFAGGMAGKLKAVALSGPSGGFVPATLPLAELSRGWQEKLPKSFVEKTLATKLPTYDIRDFPLDLQCSRDMGLMLGAGMMVYAEGSNMLDHALNCLEFFRNESCGKCVPCRIGTQKMVEIAASFRNQAASRAKPASWEPVIADLAQAMELTSICGLGVVAPKPLTSVLKYFPEDVASFARS
ncbi:MAG: NAD(P)H-dependent oxidoreductase subunit E [Planctomycetia bacterium]|nr:NAD(P)H-dependent oxidoreductase subunit E [Planctomycetia bacterium]